MTIVTTYTPDVIHEEPITPESSRVIQGTLRATLDGQVEQSEVTRFNSLDTPTNPADIFSTARSSSGSPTGQRLPSTTIEIEPGNPVSRCSLEVAETLGLVKRNELGNYVAVPQQQEGETLKASLPETQEIGPELFPAVQEEAFSSALADVPSPLINQALSTAVLSIAKNGTIEDFAESISSTTGIPAAQLQGAQQLGMAQFQQQADNAIKKLGVDPQTLYEWARETRHEELSVAIRDQVAARSLDGYRKLANEYLNKVAPSIEALSTAGYQIKPAAAGGRGDPDMVKIQGMWMTVEVAARLGLV